MTILGVDPGLANCGWGVVQSGLSNRLKLVDYGCIKTPSSLKLANRLQIIYLAIREVISKYNPSTLAIEDLFISKNISSALPVAHSRGAVLLLGIEEGLEIEEFAPVIIKKSTVGDGLATKEQVQKMVSLLLGMKSIPKPDHAADALAVAITAFHYQKS